MGKDEHSKTHESDPEGNTAATAQAHARRRGGDGKMAGNGAEGVVQLLRGAHELPVSQAIRAAPEAGVDDDPPKEVAERPFPLGTPRRALRVAVARAASAPRLAGQMICRQHRR